MLEMPCEFEGVAYEKLRDMQRARRERNLEHLREGVGLAQAARAVGVSKRAGKVWRNGRTRLSGRDERALVDRYSGGVEKPKGVDGHHLSLEERIEIADTPRAGCSSRQIAEKLGRSPSTIGREVRNNAGPTGEHGPYRAQQMSSDRLRRLKPVKIVSGPALRALVRGRLDARRSPERISGWLRGPLACTRNRPQSPSGPITTETGTVAGPVGADSGGGCNAR